MAEVTRLLLKTLLQNKNGWIFNKYVPLAWLANGRKHESINKYSVAIIIQHNRVSIKVKSRTSRTTMYKHEI
ncbi:hypothetical protein ERO13_D13G187050v2 [Gossypium hirsutum]|uniref:Uncharacterized protein n=2 Tax=Gossypium TaxID=3633 RepID=A0A0D2U347_GOSRA|nr:hypothetical protein ERO13_D13G187050v2 [Gossypium hirsutum]KJB63389.1 hypothetical protein B456_010G245100 [Gossypium raimondii]TYI48029.1 hypothetical protein E1A91_D13G217800v1 [Gossypium mustelinum]